MRIVTAGEASDVVVPPTPEVAGVVFGDRLPVAEAYVARLADTGITHGLIGPREAPRLWDRHVLNSAVVHLLLARGQRVADVGAGAGLPGIPLAIARPDLHVTLVEPLLRRTVWLTDTVGELGLDNVTVHRGRAESLWGVDRFAAVVARAVARLADLARWTFPLLEAGGALHALKGDRARHEVDEDGPVLRALGAEALDVRDLGQGVVDPLTVVVTAVVGGPPPVPGPAPRRARPGRSGRRRH